MTAATTPDRNRAKQLERSTLLSAIAPLVLDLGSTLAFYLILMATGEPRFAAAVGMALALVQTIFAIARRRPVAPLQWASNGMVLVLGSITLLTDDPRFVLMKATLVYGVIGGSMLTPGWMTRYIPTIAVAHLPGPLLRWFEKAWAALLLGTGLINLVLVLAASSQVAAKFMAIWVFASKLVLFAVQYIWCRSVARPAIKVAMEGNA